MNDVFETTHVTHPLRPNLVSLLHSDSDVVASKESGSDELLESVNQKLSKKVTAELHHKNNGENFAIKKTNPLIQWQIWQNKTRLMRMQIMFQYACLRRHDCQLLTDEAQFDLHRQKMMMAIMTRKKSTQKLDAENHWEMSLRNNDEKLVMIGNIFSDLFCRITQKDATNEELMFNNHAIHQIDNGAPISDFQHDFEQSEEKSNVANKLLLTDFAMESQINVDEFHVLGHQLQNEIDVKTQQDKVDKSHKYHLLHQHQQIKITVLNHHYIQSSLFQLNIKSDLRKFLKISMVEGILHPRQKEHIMMTVNNQQLLSASEQFQGLSIVYTLALMPLPHSLQLFGKQKHGNSSGTIILKAKSSYPHVVFKHSLSSSFLDQQKVLQLRKYVLRNIFNDILLTSFLKYEANLMSEYLFSEKCKILFDKRNKVESSMHSFSTIMNNLISFLFLLRRTKQTYNYQKELYIRHRILEEALDWCRHGTVKDLGKSWMLLYIKCLRNSTQHDDDANLDFETHNEKHLEIKDQCSDIAQQLDKLALFLKKYVIVRLKGQQLLHVLASLHKSKIYFSGREGVRDFVIKIVESVNKYSNNKAQLKKQTTQLPLKIERTDLENTPKYLSLRNLLDTELKNDATDLQDTYFIKANGTAEFQLLTKTHLGRFDVHLNLSIENQKEIVRQYQYHVKLIFIQSFVEKFGITLTEKTTHFLADNKNKNLQTLLDALSLLNEQALKFKKIVQVKFKKTTEDAVLVSQVISQLYQNLTIQGHEQNDATTSNTIHLVKTLAEALSKTKNCNLLIHPKINVSLQKLKSFVKLTTYIVIYFADVMADSNFLRKTLEIISCCQLCQIIVYITPEDVSEFVFIDTSKACVYFESSLRQIKTFEEHKNITFIEMIEDENELNEQLIRLKTCLTNCNVENVFCSNKLNLQKPYITITQSFKDDFACDENVLHILPEESFFENKNVENVIFL